MANEKEEIEVFSLKTKIKVKPIKKTTAKFWAELQEETELTLEYKMQYLVDFMSDYKPDIFIYMNDVLVLKDSPNRIMKNLKNFEVVELK